MDMRNNKNLNYAGSRVQRACCMSIIPSPRCFRLSYAAAIALSHEEKGHEPTLIYKTKQAPQECLEEA